MGTRESSRTAAELFRPGSKARDTKERLLFTALDLFYTYGFHEVGLDRILDAVGVTKTTFYKHFDSRDQLIMEAVGVRNEWESAAFGKRVQEKAGYEPRAMLLAMFDVLDEWFNDPEYRQCIFMSACAEYPWRNHPVHRAAAAHYVSAEREILGMATAAGAMDPPALARAWILLLQGAVTARMTLGDDGAARRARPIAETTLASHLSAPAPAHAKPASRRAPRGARASPQRRRARR